MLSVAAAQRARELETQSISGHTEHVATEVVLERAQPLSMEYIVTSGSMLSGNGLNDK